MDLVCTRVDAVCGQRETYGLTSQMRRSSVSIAANIAEGHARRATRDYIRFLSISKGSLRELETCWEVSLLLDYVRQDQLRTAEGLGTEVGKMLNALRDSLKRRAGLPLNPES